MPCSADSNFKLLGSCSYSEILVTHVSVRRTLRPAVVKGSTTCRRPALNLLDADWLARKVAWML